jgi:hypothetical protein
VNTCGLSHGDDWRPALNGASEVWDRGRGLRLGLQKRQ